MAAGNLVEAPSAARLAYLRELSTWSVFGRAWTTREERIRKAALAQVAQGARPTTNWTQISQSRESWLTGSNRSTPTNNHCSGRRECVPSANAIPRFG